MQQTKKKKKRGRGYNTSQRMYLFKMDFSAFSRLHSVPNNTVVHFLFITLQFI